MASFSSNDLDDDEASRQSQLRTILDNLTQVESALQAVVQTHRHGQYGYITREWGFTAPGGLGGRLGSKFQPWEDKLGQVQNYFWPLEAYLSMEERPFGQVDPVRFGDLSKHAEQLHGNTPLHDFLKIPPEPAVVLEEEDLQDYRTAAKLFILLGTLSHLYGNSSVDRTRAILPPWIEDPLLQVAERLQVAPTLSGHFLVQENWMWKSNSEEPRERVPPPSSSSQGSSDAGDAPTIPTTSTPLVASTTSGGGEAGGSRPVLQKDKTRQKDLLDEEQRAMIQCLLQECTLEDRRYRFKIYPKCFLGHEAVDALQKFVDTREDAVRLGRQLNQRFHLFYHVTNDHLLCDKHLFYRFHEKWQQKIDTNITKLIDGAKTEEQNNATVGITGCLRFSNIPEALSTSITSTLMDDDENNHNDTSNARESEEPPKPPPIPTSRLLRPRDLWRRGSDGSRQRSVSETSTDNNNNPALERFHSKPLPEGGRPPRPLTRESLDLQELSTRNMMSDRSFLFLSTNRTNQILLNSSGPTSLQEAMSIIAIMSRVPVKDRRYHLRLYKQCFIGSQLIDVLMEHEVASSRKDALRVALRINHKFRVFSHVVDNHQLKDEYLFYRFTNEFQSIVHKKDMESIMDAATNTKTTSNTSSSNTNARLLDENMKRSSYFTNDVELGGSIVSSDSQDGGEKFDLDEEEEFRFDNIIMLYPAFGNNHERVNQLIPACMGHAMAGLPFYVLDIITAMRNVIAAELAHGSSDSDVSSVDTYESRRLYDLLYKVAFSISRCKEEFQQMSTDPTKRTFNSKYVSIKQTQPLSNGVLVRNSKDGERKVGKGTTGTQFPYFHLLDWLLGRFQQLADEKESSGLVAMIASVDDSFPLPQREFIQCLTRLGRTATLRGFLEALERPTDLLSAYNHLIECYGGEGGVLQAHCRKLYSYIHNHVQSSTSGTNHLKATRGSESDVGCPIHSSVAADNHKFAAMMFKHMRHAAADRWKLRLPPLMTEVGKVVYSTSESGGFTTVALDLSDSGLLYEYGDVVKVLLPNSEKTTLAWIHSLAASGHEFFRLADIKKLHRDTGNGWGWGELWEALCWSRYEQDGGLGVPLELIARYIEQGQIRDDSDKLRWVNSPLDLSGGRGSMKLFAVPPAITLEDVSSLEPVSPRVYSVSGVEEDRVFLLVSNPQDGARHHGYEGMSNSHIQRVHCSFSPATFFLIPPKGVNLLCIASGTGVSPFVGLADVIGSRPGSYTIVHQCKSSDLFLANSQSWLDFTAVNPGALVMGYISGDRSRRNCPMFYVIRNGAFEETTVLRRHNACAYYFECQLFQSVVRDRYQRKNNGLNLAYCCGGVKSAIEPLKNFCAREKMVFEFTCETYGVPPTLTKHSVASLIGGSIVNMDYVSPIHPGGDQILRQLNDIIVNEFITTTPCSDDPSLTATPPDHSVAFFELHPHAYNLHRCLRTPLDADSDAFAAFLERQAMSNSVMTSMATRYAQVALSSPKDSKVVRIATELQTAALREQLKAGDTHAAQQSAEYLEALLSLLPDGDQDTERWLKSLNDFQESFSEGT